MVCYLSSEDTQKEDLYAYACCGLHGKGLGGGCYKDGFCEKLPPYLIDPMPAGYKTGPMLAKAKPISDGGSTSVITYLQGKTCSEAAVESGVR